MARGITEDDVHGAADTLVEAGERPTVERIRAHLGSGSPNTVTRHLESWWGMLGARLASQRQAITLPAVPFAIGDLAAKLWDASLRSARAEANEALAIDRNALAAERLAFQDETRALAAQRLTAVKAADEANNARQRIEQRLTDLTALLAQLQDRAADLENQRDVAQDQPRQLQAELARHRRQADEREANLAGERQRHAEQVRATEDRAHTEVDRARQEDRVVQKQLDNHLRERDLLAARVLQREQALTETHAAAQRDAAVAKAQLNARRVPAAKPARRKAVAKSRAPVKRTASRRTPP